MPVAQIESPSSVAIRTTSTPLLRFGTVALIVCILIQWAVYYDSFRILPAGDDFPIVNEIHRGNEKGVGVFFSDSVIEIGYRPLKSLAIWFSGQLSPAHPMQAMRVLNLLTAALCGLAVLLWSRAIRLGKIGTVTALLVMLLHPVMTASIGSCDGIDTVISTALLWLGAWCVYHFRARPAVATIGAVTCFLVGVGFKENLFALVPLSFIVIVMFWRREHRVGAIALLIAMSIAAAAMIAVRFYVIRGGLSAGQGMLRFNPRQLAENVSLFASGLLFIGDTIWVYVRSSKPVLALVGATCAIFFFIVAGGVWQKLKQRGRDDVESEDTKCWIIFLLLGLVCASFPTIVLFHVSEMYVPPMVVPFALFCGIALEGWLARLRSGPARFALGAISGAALVVSIVSIHHKIGGLRDVGDRAANQIDQILQSLGADAHDMKVAVLFDAQQLPPKRTYSVFRMGDEILMVHAGVLNWARPGRGLVLTSPSLESAPAFDVSTVDAAFKWDVPTQKFTRVK